MTDDAELIARLREDKHHWTPRDGYNIESMAQAMLDAADALEQRTRTITALQGQLAEARKAEDEWVAIAAQNSKDASARLRTVEAETWEQAATDVATKLRIGDDGSRMVLYQEFHRRAKAAREGT